MPLTHSANRVELLLGVRVAPLLQAALQTWSNVQTEKQDSEKQQQEQQHKAVGQGGSKLEPWLTMNNQQQQKKQSGLPWQQQSQNSKQQQQQEESRGQQEMKQLLSRAVTSSPQHHPQQDQLQSHLWSASPASAAAALPSLSPSIHAPSPSETCSSSCINTSPGISSSSCCCCRSRGIDAPSSSNSCTASSGSSSVSNCCTASSISYCSGAVSAASGGVVMVGVGRSWATGVIITTGGLLLTNAHLFDEPGAIAGRAAVGLVEREGGSPGVPRGVGLGMGVSAGLGVEALNAGDDDDSSMRGSPGVLSGLGLGMGLERGPSTGVGVEPLHALAGDEAVSMKCCLVAEAAGEQGAVSSQLNLLGADAAALQRDCEELFSKQQHQQQQQQQPAALGISNCSWAMTPAAYSSSHSSNSSSSSGVVYVRLSDAAAAAAGSLAAASPWLPARVLHRFRGHLDLAVLEIIPPPGSYKSSSRHQYSTSSFKDPLDKSSSSAGSGTPSAVAGLPQGNKQSQQQQQQQQEEGGLRGNVQLRPLVLSASAPVAGQDVMVVGHGLFGPRQGWGPSVTAGSLALVVNRPAATAAAGAAATTANSGISTGACSNNSSSSRSSPGVSWGVKEQEQQQSQQQLHQPEQWQQEVWQSQQFRQQQQHQQPQQQRETRQLQQQSQQQQSQQQQFQQQTVPQSPAMLISTAAVHGGASGGALLCPVTGQLLGLVTSNARHVRGSTLPRLNFCIPAAELAPVWEWAQQHEQHSNTSSDLPAVAAGGAGAGAGAASLGSIEAFRLLDVQGGAAAAGGERRGVAVAGTAVVGGDGGIAPGSIEALRLVDVQDDVAAAKIWGLKSPVVVHGASRGHHVGGAEGFRAFGNLLGGEKFKGRVSKL